MGSRVNVCSVNILDNPAPFGSVFKLEITFEVFENLPRDLEWELVYVGSAESSTLDQILDSVLVGPVPEGRHKFVFEAESPDVSKIPESEIVGVTVLLLRCKYNEQEFLNLGWFVSNVYTDPELKENPPTKPQTDKLTRTILTDDVRVTTFAIKWDENAPDEYPPEEENADVETASGDAPNVSDEIPKLVGEDDEPMPEENPVTTPDEVTAVESASADSVETSEPTQTTVTDAEDGKETAASEPLADRTNDGAATLE